MQLRCIRPFSQYKPGDTAEVPDGAAFDPFHWEPVPAGSAPALPDITSEPEHPADRIARTDAVHVQFPPAAPKEM